MTKAAVAAYKSLHRLPFTKLVWGIANQIGIAEALLIEIIEDWCQNNATAGRGKYYHDNEWWTAATYQEWSKMYPCLGNARKLQRLLLKIEAEGYLISGQFLSGQWNQTKFYRPNPETVGQLILNAVKTAETSSIPKVPFMDTPKNESIHSEDDRVSAQEIMDNPSSERSSINRSKKEIKLEDHPPTPPAGGGVCEKKASSLQQEKEEESEAVAVKVEVEIASEEEIENETHSLVESEKQAIQTTNLNPGEDQGAANENDYHYLDHPVVKQEAMFYGGKEPWFSSPGINGWNSEFVEYYRQYLSLTPRYSRELKKPADTGAAKRSLARLRKEPGRTELWSHWEDYQEALDLKSQANQVDKLAKTPYDSIHDLGEQERNAQERRLLWEQKQKQKNSTN